MGKGARQKAAVLHNATFRCARCNGTLLLDAVSWDWGGAQVTLSPCSGCKDILTTAEMRKAARDAGTDEMLRDMARAAADQIADDEQRWGEERNREEESAD